jgi:hypothetical protein
VEQHLPVPQEHDGVDERFDVGDEMGGQDHQRVGVEVLQDRAQDDVPGRGVHPGDRLVEQVHAGPARHGEGDLELLAHPLRQLFEGAARRQLEEVDHLPGAAGVEVLEEPGVQRDRVPAPRPVGKE